VGITTVYVTHDQEEAMTLADRIAVLNDGRLQQFAEPKVVYYRPANRFVADFIGSPSMNFVNVRLDGEDGDWRLSQEAFDYAVSDRFVEALDPTTPLEMGIRPENVRIDGEAPPDRRITATVDVVEVVGSDNFVYLDLAGKEFRVRTESQVEPEEDETVAVTFDETDVHLFDRDTGEALTHGYQDTEVASTVEQSDATAD
jgi:multiple sugar transport system ATP-binding protein